MYDRVHFEGVGDLCISVYTVKVWWSIYDRGHCEGVGGLYITEHTVKVWVVICQGTLYIAGDL